MFEELKDGMQGLRDDLGEFRIDLKDTQKDANLQIRSLRRDLLTLNKTLIKLIAVMEKR